MKQQRAFRFGIAAGKEASREAWILQAREAEELGYATFLWADHPEYPLATAVALQAAADATTTLRVGSMVFNNDFRHPAMLAKEAASIDVLTGGRFELGIGAGWKQSEYEQVGLPFDTPKVRLDRFTEALQLIKALFSDGPVTFNGTYYTVKELNGLPRPTQKPHPPIFVGGGGKRVLSIAAREADIIGVHFNFHHAEAVDRIAWEQHTPITLAQKVAWIQEAAGPRFNALELNISIRYVDITDHITEAIERYRQQARWSGITPQDVLDSPYILIGSSDQVVDKLIRLRQQYAISYIVVPAAYRRTFAPVVARLAGQSQ